MSYLGAAVLLMFMWFPFRLFDLLGGFSNRFTIAVMFGAIFQHIPEYVFKTEN